MINKNLLLFFGGSLLLIFSAMEIFTIYSAGHGHFNFPPKREEEKTIWLFGLIMFGTGIYLFTKINKKK